MPRVIIHIEQVAEQCGVSIPTVRTWLAKGYGPPCARLGKRLAFRQDDVDAWLDERFADAATAGSKA